MMSPEEQLDHILGEAQQLGETPAVNNEEICIQIDYVCRCLNNRAGVRLLMSCMLAKLDRPDSDPRKPYTEIGSDDCFSGRTYDERFLTHFISNNRLPCNMTTAFLTPALRNHNSALTVNTNLVGRPRLVYDYTLHLLDEVASGRMTAKQILTETVRVLLHIRQEKQSRINELLKALRHGEDSLPLSSERIVILLEQHLACRHSSRLPVLIVTAAYHAATNQIGEKANPLRSHLSADEQSGALGDVEICLLNEERVKTVYEMKSKRVTQDDIDRALQKIAATDPPVDNYVFITTESVNEEVHDYAATLYDQTGGIEVAILDCIGFVRHFLHLFHRFRTEFLDAYQQLVLEEPDSAVNQPLKEAFLSLRQVAEFEE